MTRHKRAWREPNPDHPRGKHGRFVKRGSAVGALAKLSGEKAAPGAPIRNKAVRDYFASRMAAQKLPAHDPAKVLAEQNTPEIKELRKIQAKPTGTLERDLAMATPGTQSAKDHKRELDARRKAEKVPATQREKAKAAPTNAVSSVASKPVAETVVGDEGDATPARRFERRAAAAASGDEGLASAPIGMTDTLTHQIQYIDQTDRDLRGVTVDEAKVLRDYRLTFFESMNRNRRLGRRDTNNEALDRLMERSPLSQDVVVHRGVVDPARFIPGWNSDGDLTGLEWDEVANASTTTEVDKVKKFLGIGKGKDRAVQMRILVPKGVRAIQISSRGEGGFESQAEAELLLEHGLRFRVVADHGFSKAENGPNGTKIKGGVRRIDVEIVPPSGMAKG